MTEEEKKLHWKVSAFKSYIKIRKLQKHPHPNRLLDKTLSEIREKKIACMEAEYPDFKEAYESEYVNST